MDMKRPRMKYTQTQTDLLERHFDISQYPDTDTQEKLALEIGVSTDRISIWFQNRRSKFKRQCHTSHVTWMRKQIFTSGDGKDCAFGTPRLPVQRPACHVLSPLESQVHRNDVTVECSPGFNSPLGTDFCHQRQNETNNSVHISPEVLQKQYSCAVRIPGSCMKNNTMMPSKPATQIIRPTMTSQGFQDASFNYVPYLGWPTQQSATLSPFSNDFMSCDAKKAFTRSNNWTQGVHDDVINKENSTPRGCRLPDDFTRPHFSERLLNVDISKTNGIPYTPIGSHDEKVSLAPKWSRGLDESRSGFLPSPETYTGYQRKLDYCDYNSPLDISYVEPVDILSVTDGSIGVLEQWI